MLRYNTHVPQLSTSLQGECLLFILIESCVNSKARPVNKMMRFFCELNETVDGVTNNMYTKGELDFLLSIA